MDWGFVAKIDQEEAFAPIRELQIKSIFLTLVIIVLVILASIHISNSITNPLKHLEKASEKIAKGELSTPLEIESDGEIGSLSRSLSKMQKELKR